MKLRHPWLIRAAGLGAALTLPRWLWTLDYRYWYDGPNTDPGHPGLAGRYIYALWHEYLLVALCRYAAPDIHVLISKHADGQLAAEVCHRLGVPTVRGSTTRGGAAAVRRLLQAGRAAHLALTPDGPRGPRRRLQEGVVYLAAQTGLPIVPVGFGLHRPWRFRSWDRMALPRPGSRATCVTAAPIAVPPQAVGPSREEWRQRVEAAMAWAAATAEHWAETGAHPARTNDEARMTKA